jgi:beta-lactamase class A
MRIIKVFIVIFVLGGALIAGLSAGFTTYRTETNIFTPTITLAPGIPSPFPTITPTPTSGLSGLVQGMLAGAPGMYGIVIENLSTGEQYEVGEHRIFEPASLYKLWVMATVFDQISSGKLSLDTQMSQDVAILNNEFDIATETADLVDGTVSYSVRDALEQMITISDNYAALLLSERIGLQNVQNYLRNHGLSESFLGEPPQTTAYDIALFMKKLYGGELSNQINTKEMLGLLKRQKLNQKLPRYLPQNTVIAHKTGELGSYTHDAGIVYSSTGDYVIAVMTESDYPTNENERISKISEAVYDYFKSL